MKRWLLLGGINLLVLVVGGFVVWDFAYRHGARVGICSCEGAHADFPPELDDLWMQVCMDSLLLKRSGGDDP